MAEASLQRKLEDHLSCSICQDTYTDPKVLQCNHVYCRHCLVGLAHQHPQGLPCPTCRQVTSSPEGVADLQPAFRTDSLLGILNGHKKMKLFIYCPQHQNRELELYCETCKDVICLQCYIQQHNGHQYSLGAAAAEALHATLPDPSQCHVLSGAPDAATVGEKSATLIQVNTHEGKPLEKLVKSFECELVSELTGIRARGSVERRGQSQYEISYQPTIKGRHQLHIKVMGEHIRASPYSVAVKKSPEEKLGTPILTIGGINGPYGVAVNKSGEVIVTEYRSHCVSVLSPNGHKLRSFGTCGAGQGQFMGPRGVAVDGEGNIVVVDSCSASIQKFTAEGQFLTAVGTPDSVPLGIAFNASNNRVYVSDTHRDIIQILNSDLTLSSTFGKYGKCDGEFSYPRGIAFDSTGNVYVADSGNHRIQVFTSTGKFLRMFRSHCEVRREQYPNGIAVDDEDKVYVTEILGNCVSVFTSEGQFVTSFGKDREYYGYRSVTVDSNGVVYVCVKDTLTLF